MAERSNLLHAGKVLAGGDQYQGQKNAGDNRLAHHFHGATSVERVLAVILVDLLHGIGHAVEAGVAHVVIGASRLQICTSP